MEAVPPNSPSMGTGGPWEPLEVAGLTRSQTLLVWGRLDGIVPIQHGQALQQALPNARLNIIDRCGHLPMSEKPETFNRILRNFLVGDEEEIPEVARI